MWKDETDGPAFARELRGRDRLLVLWHAEWCEHSLRLLPVIDALEPDACAPLARAHLRRAGDPRWDEYRVEVVPTLVYYESGEELERLEAVRGKGLRRADVEEFLDVVDAIQPEPVLPRRMHGPKRF